MNLQMQLQLSRQGYRFLTSIHPAKVYAFVSQLQSEGKNVLVFRKGPHEAYIYIKK